MFQDGSAGTKATDVTKTIHLEERARQARAPTPGAALRQNTPRNEPNTQPVHKFPRNKCRCGTLKRFFIHDQVQPRAIPRGWGQHRINVRDKKRRPSSTQVTWVDPNRLWQRFGRRLVTTHAHRANFEIGRQEDPEGPPNHSNFPRLEPGRRSSQRVPKHRGLIPAVYLWTVSRTLELSLQSSFQLSLTVLVCYRSRSRI